MMKLPCLCEAVFNSETDYAIVVLDAEGRLVKWNVGAARMLGLGDAALGAHCSVLDPAPAVDDHVSAEEIEAARQTGKASFDRCHLRSDGTQFWAEGSITPLHDADHKLIGYLKMFTDSTERHKGVGDMLFAATHDPLTGLANRASFNERLSEWIDAVHRTENVVILHLIDLDNFKHVNDRLGQVAGDLLLQQVAGRLKSSTRSTDYVARLAGDEFAVLQTGARSALFGLDMAQKLVDVLDFPFEFDGRTVGITASIGIAVVPDGVENPDALFRRADAAMHRRKRSGRNGYSFYTEQLDREAHDRSNALAAVKSAVHNKEFELHYQPKISALSGRVASNEALLRCTNERLKARSTSEIVELIRHAGLMLDMSEWIVVQACRDAAAWPNQDADIKVCVNLCAVELSNRRIVTIINDALLSAGLPRSRFIVELTEQVLFDSEAHGAAVLMELHENGITIALDDFGTGYSALSYLTAFPIRVLKLDMSLIREIPHNEPSCKVVRGVIHLAHTLGLKVVAEGVETRDQHIMLRDEKCDEMQGFYFSPAVDQNNISRMLADPGFAPGRV
ncbi:MAG TPA: EAL domain-containing protein [Telluria sp.]|nr:EAL domain-containing protein [Telluria sp.]